MCVEHLKEVVKEVEKVNEREINESFKEVHASISHFKTEVENLRMQVIDNYPHGKRHPSLKKDLLQNDKTE